MGGLGERNSQSRSVLAVEPGRKRWVTLGLVGCKTVDRQSVIDLAVEYYLTGQPALLPKLPPPPKFCYLCRPYPPAPDPRPATKKPCLPFIPVGGNCMRTGPARRICRQRRQSGRSSSLSYSFFPVVPE